MNDAPIPTEDTIEAEEATKAVALACLDCAPSPLPRMEPDRVGELDVFSLADELARVLNPLAEKIEKIGEQVTWLGNFAVRTDLRLDEAEALSKQGAELMAQAEAALSGGGIGAVMKLLTGR